VRIKKTFSTYMPPAT